MKPNQVYKINDAVLFGSEKREGFVKAVKSRSITVKLSHSTVKITCKDIEQIHLEHKTNN